MKNIRVCVDCIDPFCVGCDEDAGRCPDCNSMMCGDCFWDACQDRQNRCAECANPDTSSRRFVDYPGGRKMDKRYTEIHKGKLD